MGEFPQHSQLRKINVYLPKIVILVENRKGKCIVATTYKMSSIVLFVCFLVPLFSPQEL